MSAKDPRPGICPRTSKPSIESTAPKPKAATSVRAVPVANIRRFREAACRRVVARRGNMRGPMKRLTSQPTPMAASGVSSTTQPPSAPAAPGPVISGFRRPLSQSRRLPAKSARSISGPSTMASTTPRGRATATKTIRIWASRIETPWGSNCHRNAPSTSANGTAMNRASTEGMICSITGAKTRAARKPSTTEGSEAIISMAGFTQALIRGLRNSLV